MLVRLKIKNFKSIKEETIIDFTPTKYTFLNDTNVYNNITKGAMFVGGNATGKSNVINSISILLDLLFVNDRIDMSRFFCIFSKDETMFLEYSFIFDGDNIIYYIEFNRKGEIIKESLLLNNLIMLDRLSDNVDSSLTENRYFDSKDTEPHTLFIKLIYFNTKFTKYPILSRWFKFLKNSIYFNTQRSTFFPPTPEVTINKENQINLYQYLIEFGADEINNFFKLYNFDLELCLTETKRENDLIPFQIGNKFIYFKRKCVREYLSMNYESSGNIVLLQILPSLLHVISNEGMLLIDEFHSAFHNILEELLVKHFMQYSNRSQLFFVAHSTNLLNSTILRPDQIFTVDFCDSNGTKLKKVSSESPRESQNFEKMYLSGMLNGIPSYTKNNKIK